MLSAFAFFSYVSIGEKCRRYKKYVYLWPKYHDDGRIGNKYITDIYNDSRECLLARVPTLKFYDGLYLKSYILLHEMVTKCITIIGLLIINSTDSQSS